MGGGKNTPETQTNKNLKYHSNDLFIYDVCTERQTHR